MSNFFKLEHLGALTLSGPDAVTYAQAQFTNDIAAIDVNHWYPGAWCDPSGRVLAVMLAGRREEHVALVVPAWQVDALLERLKMYAIGRKVDFSSSADVCGCRDAGESASSLSYDSRRSLLIGRADCRDDSDEQARWQLDDLEARFPWLSPDSAGRHLPQSLGMEGLGGLSYTKGCFPGQEVMARVHYRGKVGYRVVQVRFDTGTVAPGTTLRHEDGSRAGEMLWSLPTGSGSAGLAVIAVGTEDGTPVLAESGRDGLSGRVSL